jgi:hypothetical protein
MVANVNVNTNQPEYNLDGLAVRYGLKEAKIEKGGNLNTWGDLKIAKYKVDFADVALGVDATHNFILSYQNVIPKLSVIEKVEFHVTHTWDSASNDVALNFGLLKDDATATVEHTIVDADGLMDTVPKTALDTAGAIVTVLKGDSLPAASTYVGAELGSARAENQLVSCYWENNAPTSGNGYLLVYYRDRVLA